MQLCTKISGIGILGRSLACLQSTSHREGIGLHGDLHQIHLLLNDTPCFCVMAEEFERIPLFSGNKKQKKSPPHIWERNIFLTPV